MSKPNAKLQLPNVKVASPCAKFAITKKRKGMDFYSTLVACKTILKIKGEEFKDKFGFRLYMFSIQIITFATDMQI